MLQVIEMTITQKAPVKRVAREFQIPSRTLDRYYKKYVKNADSERETQNVRVEHVGYKKPRQVFSDKQEQVLVDYIEKASDIYYARISWAHTTRGSQTCILVCKTNVQMSQTWSEKSSAAVDWFTAFLKSDPRLSIRTPEATSLSRATSFNPMNVAKFFKNLQKVYSRHKFEAADV